MATPKLGRERPIGLSAIRTLTLGQFYVGADVGYSFGDFEPYAHAMYHVMTSKLIPIRAALALDRGQDPARGQDPVQRQDRARQRRNQTMTKSNTVLGCGTLVQTG